jgi:hypothetical protein
MKHLISEQLGIFESTDDFSTYLKSCHDSGITGVRMFYICTWSRENRYVPFKKIGMWEGRPWQMFPFYDLSLWNEEYWEKFDAIHYGLKERGMTAWGVLHDRCSWQYDKYFYPPYSCVQKFSKIKVAICNDSGVLANQYCPDWRLETRLYSDIPADVCSIHTGPDSPTRLLWEPQKDSKIASGSWGANLWPHHCNYFRVVKQHLDYIGVDYYLEIMNEYAAEYNATADPFPDEPNRHYHDSEDTWAIYWHKKAADYLMSIGVPKERLVTSTMYEKRPEMVRELASHVGLYSMHGIVTMDGLAKKIAMTDAAGLDHSKVIISGDP